MQTPSSFSIPTPDLPPLDDSLILGLLAQQTSTRADNADILAYFEKHADLASRSEFCRTSYKQIYTQLYVGERMAGFIRHDQYLELWEGNYLTKSAQSNLTWDAVDDFVGKLQKMGYEVKYGPRVKHMAVRHQDSKRFVRLDGVAPQFSESELRGFFTQLKKLPPEMQQEYQAENQPVQQSWQKEPELPVMRRARCRSRLNRPYKKVGGIMACYYHYCALLRRSYRGKSGRRCYYLLREDFSKFNRYPCAGGLHDAPGLYGAGRHRIACLCGGADLPRNYRRSIQ